MRPEAEKYLGHYVRAIHEFQAGGAGEVSLGKGDVLKVTEVVDKNWLRGHGRELQGAFPTDFVEIVKLPVSVDNHTLFAATESFPALQDGDLQFSKGDVVVGLRQIDANWWHGQRGSEVGMFPTTHVMELEIPKLIKQRSRSVHASETLYARALVDAVAQLDEELSFLAGEIITVTEVIDEDWYQGEIHGKQGMFLASCVELLNDAFENDTTDTDDKNVTPEVSGKSSVPVTDVGQCREPQRNSESSSVLSGQAGVAPMKEDTHNDSHEFSENFTKNRSISYTSENTKAHGSLDSGVTPYARTLYPFTGEMADELSFDAHDIVTLIQHVDDQWIEGELDGKIGLFPAKYVEIVVDCPYAYSTGELGSDTLQAGIAGSEAGAVARVTETLEEEVYALVLFTFQAETSQDLSVSEGDTITVIKKVDDNWVLAQDESGQTGMCPAGFIDMVGAFPDHEIPADSQGTSQVNSAALAGSSDEPANSMPSDSAVKPAQTDKPRHSEIVENEREIESVKPAPAIKVSMSMDSISSSAHSKPKPPVKPKPQIGPKPVIKPKPSLSSSKQLTKPMLTPSNHLLGSSESIAKSASSKSLPDYESCLTDSRGKSQSMTALNQVKDKVLGTSPVQKQLSASPVQTQLSTASTGSRESLPQSDTEERRNSSSAVGAKPMFDNWDLSRPLDSLLQNEFKKAKVEVDERSRSSSGLSSGSTDSSDRERAGSVKSTGMSSASRTSSSCHKPDAQNHRLQKRSSVGNYSRENFYGDLQGDMTGMSVGNSTFFMDFTDSAPVSKKQNGTSIYDRTVRKSTARKPAPPRPVGPRIAPPPPRAPVTPVKAVTPTPGKVPRRQAPAVPPLQGAVSRPSNQSKKLNRPAPPKPQPFRNQQSVKGDNQSRSRQPGKDEDLLAFSPNSSIEVEEDSADSEAAKELRSRIAVMEKDLESCIKSRKELHQMSEHLEPGDKTEVHDNIQFYEDNIQGITKELQTLKDNLSQICPKEMDRQAEEKAMAARKEEEERQREEMKRTMEEQKQERREKRQKVIDELFQTEKDFLQSLSLIMETFLAPHMEKHPDVDLELLFGNIEEVADVSQRLLTQLEDAVSGKDFSKQVIGTSFIRLAEDMKNAYAPYCRNHDDVITLIEKYMSNSEVKEFIDGLLDKMREISVVFDLEALLIKPVQRILKYPLLLNALLKTTDDDHPDKTEILNAINAMTDVATAINEYKRRKDLVYKYKKETDSSIGDLLSKLSLHSIKKKSSRIRERFSANMGFIDQTRDENFDKMETRYRNFEKIVKVFVKDVQIYMDNTQDIVNSLECLVTDIDDFYGEKRDCPEVQKYQGVQAKLQGEFFPTFRVEVDDLVVQPLSTLVQRFEGPNKVIQKRYDKLLDYDNMNRKAKEGKVPEKAVQGAKQNYEALNAQLLDELPCLYTLAFQLFQDCVGSFVRAQREFVNSLLKDMYPLLGLQFLGQESAIEVFNIKHTQIVDRLAMLSFMPRSFSPRMADLKQDKKSKRPSQDVLPPGKSMEAVAQSDSQKVYVTQQYSGRLFRVGQMHVALDMMDISLCEGDIVGIIKEQDPMGNKERWFIDNGAIKGFVPKKILIPYEQSPQRPISVSSSPDSKLTGSRNSAVLQELVEDDEMDFALEEDMAPALPLAGVSQGQGFTDAGPASIEEELELYYAEYSFDARSSNETSMFEHQVVTVLSKRDLEGNPEWWYVDADGSKGYVPAAYLRRMDTHGDPT